MKSKKTACSHNHNVVFDGASTSYRRALILVILINALMFMVEVVSGIIGNSQALLADALDFLMDTVTYSISLLVIGKSILVRGRAALFKGYSLAFMGILVLLTTIYRTFEGYAPNVSIISLISLLALTANGLSLMVLLQYREGDANVRSVWLCSRNDAIGNLLVLSAAVFIYFTESYIPDLIVASLLASLFLKSAWDIVRQAKMEIVEGEKGHRLTIE